MHSRSASLTFRGFGEAPETVERLVGVKAAFRGAKGAHLKPGVGSPLIRSAVGFALEFAPQTSLNDMVVSLLEHLGGVEHLCKVREDVLPEYFELDLVLPVKRSDEQEGGFIAPTTLDAMCKLKISLSFQFL